MAECQLNPGPLVGLCCCRSPETAARCQPAPEKGREMVYQQHLRDYGKSQHTPGSGLHPRRPCSSTSDCGRFPGSARTRWLQQSPPNVLPAVEPLLPVWPEHLPDPTGICPSHQSTARCYKITVILGIVLMERGESGGAEALRTQGKARLGIEGQSLRRTRLLPKSQPRGAGALIHSFLEKSEPEPARIGDLTHSAQQRGHLQKHIPKARLSGCVKRLPAFPPSSCDAMAAAFQHFGAWTAPICNPSALHPFRTPLSTPSRSILLLPAPAQPALPYTISTPISPPSPS
ncbi:Hypothetical predicted protein [Lynx pardinus]|uniref:Uncharacterized protein n=1 Tax=Lynx pardinus TaxID=191816 RepID=A0A485PFQ3_LYNPA|nr:Hypothetical predicted protein [Lynx pardinus]